MSLMMNSEEVEMEMKKTSHSAYSNKFILEVQRQVLDSRAMHLVPGAIKQVACIKQDGEFRWPLPWKDLGQAMSTPAAPLSFLMSFLYDSP